MSELVRKPKFKKVQAKAKVKQLQMDGVIRIPRSFF
jgi:hypothetical protein